MKTLPLALSLLFLVACGKDNQSGSRPSQGNNLTPFVSDNAIHTVRDSRNAVMVEGTTKNFGIPVRNVTNIFCSSDLVGIIYSEGRGLHVRIYNSAGGLVLDDRASMVNPRLNVRFGVAGLEYQDYQGLSHYVAVNGNGKILEITAEDIRGHVENGVVAVAYRNGTAERAMAYLSNGQVIIPDRPYGRPRFRLETYMLTLSHDRGIEQKALTPLIENGQCHVAGY